MKNTILILAFSFISGSISIAQDVYYTKQATLQLVGELDGQLLALQTTQLGIKLDYETASVIVRFQLSSLKTDIDSINEMLKKSKLEVVFDGKLGLEYINTENHPPQNFEAEGKLTIGGLEAIIHGDGELLHIGRATDYACMLKMTIPLNFKDLSISGLLPGLNDKFEAVITQALLQKDKN